MTITRTRLRRNLGAAALALLCAAGFFSPAARAEGLDDSGIATDGSPHGTKQQGDWDVTVGLGIADAPKYPGANARHVEPVPIVSVKYRDFIFLGPEGLGINAIRWQGFRIGPTLGFAGGRKESDDPHLNGLGNIQKSATAGLFANYAIGHISVDASLHQAVIHTKNGLTGNLGASLHGPIIKGKLDFSAGPVFDFANGRYARTWFGVTPNQSANSGLPVYTPTGGMKEIGFNASLTYHYSQHIFVRLFGGVGELIGSVAKSPIVEDKTQGRVGLGLGYHF